jgi:hypothetical protein
MSTFGTCGKRPTLNVQRPTLNKIREILSK